VLSNLGLSYALSKRLPEAEQVLRQADAHPNADVRVRQNLALVFALQGKLQEAEAVLKRDLPASEVATSLASLRQMVAQPNSWAAIRKAEPKTARSAAGQTNKSAQTKAVAPAKAVAQGLKLELRRF
jgi:hypothetical protein